jgi:flagellar L-ring protein precursor FlgH
MPRLIILSLVFILAACSSVDHLGKAPSFSDYKAGPERSAMVYAGLPQTVERRTVLDGSSLWRGDRQSLLGDRRALMRGDIMTVVIEIDDKAEISNSTARSRDGSQNLSMPSLFGIPQRLQGDATDIDGTNPVGVSSNSSSSGDGSVRRKEKLELRVAATIVDELPNGVLAIEGIQEVRVNFEIRELLVSGYVRPEDISRQNEITYDKIASARISYGGRGQITDVQQPRYGQQVLEAILPF